ncbi:MAG: S-adenosylmethionine:tRNA ribosyltransferase-isomerase [bacterium]|nr:S-adenosylmethionine:tRNA ribosyltransferase-isomerase [bacterium]
MNSPEQWQFDLPEELIAQDPAQQRGDSRLMLVEPHQGVVSEQVFRQLPEILRSGDLLVLNDSRVLPARLKTHRADTQGKVELLLVRPVDEQTWLAMAKPARRLRPGIKLVVGGHFLEVVQKRDDGQILVRSEPSPWKLAAEYGVMPLPPYIRRQDDDPLKEERTSRDKIRYQTIYNLPDSSGAGSVAAPTAGLHFSDQTMTELANRGVNVARVSLHVGPGTFQPPTEEQISAGRLHREFFRCSAETYEAINKTRAAGGRVIAVGTTSLRVLETVARLNLEVASESTSEPTLDFAISDDNPDPFFTGWAKRDNNSWQIEGMTRLFIQPPEKVSAADGLLTNFHLPGSSLLMLVASLAGSTTWRSVYDQAVKTGMRFYSYGDCMLILPGCAEFTKGINQ